MFDIYYIYIMDLTKKIYTFKLDIGHPYDYAMCLHPELYQLYQQDLKFYKYTYKIE